MLSPIKSMVLAVATSTMALPTLAFAADLPLPTVGHVRHQPAFSACCPCGCLHVNYVYHREVRTTYGTGFDPRNFDQTQPYYYLGRLRAYPRYWVEANPLPCPEC